MIERNVIVRQGGQGWIYIPRKNSIEVEFKSVDTPSQLVSFINNIIV